MKVWEISREEGKTYKATGEFDGTLVSYTVEVDTVGNLICYDKLRIENKLSLNKILEMEFEEVIDWSDVLVDTKVFVRNKHHVCWTKAYFEKEVDGLFYCFVDGKTSWTTEQTSIYDECRLAED